MGRCSTAYNDAIMGKLEHCCQVIEKFSEEHDSSQAADEHGLLVRHFQMVKKRVKSPVW